MFCELLRDSWVERLTMSASSQCDSFFNASFSSFYFENWHARARALCPREAEFSENLRWSVGSVGVHSLRSSSDAEPSPFSGLVVAVWRYRRSKKREQLCKHVTAKSSNMTFSCGERKMDSVVKNTLKKLWLCGLLWWSLLLELASGGNNETFPWFPQWKQTPPKLISWCFVGHFCFCLFLL